MESLLCQVQGHPTIISDVDIIIIYGIHPMIFNGILMIEVFPCQAYHFTNIVKIWSKRIILFQGIILPFPFERRDVLFPFHLVCSHGQWPIPTRSSLSFDPFISLLDLPRNFHYDQLVTWVSWELLWSDGCTTYLNISPCPELDKICT